VQTVLDVDEKLLSLAEQRARRDVHRDPSSSDIWLAGVAFQRHLTFVTRNRRDLDRITGMKVENWFQ